ncbi:hypothetical protein EBZ39_03155 [bacterium]|nr:hypothetical protein [bacterium]
MSKPIRIKIDVTKIDKTAIFQGKAGAKWLDLVAWPVRESKYGETHSVKQDFGKDDPRNKECPYLGSLTLPESQPAPPTNPDPHGRNRAGYQSTVEAATPAHLDDNTDEIPW